jgi:hypothetical protein
MHRGLFLAGLILLFLGLFGFFSISLIVFGIPILSTVMIGIILMLVGWRDPG